MKFNFNKNPIQRSCILFIMFNALSFNQIALADIPTYAPEVITGSLADCGGSTTEEEPACGTAVNDLKKTTNISTHKNSTNLCDDKSSKYVVGSYQINAISDAYMSFTASYTHDTWKCESLTTAKQITCQFQFCPAGQYATFSVKYSFVDTIITEGTGFCDHDSDSGGGNFCDVVCPKGQIPHCVPVFGGFNICVPIGKY